MSIFLAVQHMVSTEFSDLQCVLKHITSKKVTAAFIAGTDKLF